MVKGLLESTVIIVEAPDHGTKELGKCPRFQTLLTKLSQSPLGANNPLLIGVTDNSDAHSAGF